MRKDAMHIIPCKNQYKVRFGAGRKFQGNGLFFEAVFSGGDRVRVLESLCRSPLCLRFDTRSESVRSDQELRSSGIESVLGVTVNPLK